MPSSSKLWRSFFVFSSLLVPCSACAETSESNQTFIGRIPEDESPCFPIEQITLDGDLADKFPWALHAVSYANESEYDSPFQHCLGTRGIKTIIHRVQNSIIKQGYITTRVMIPEQNLLGKSLKLVLIPGRISEIRFSPESHITEAASKLLTFSSGELLNLKDLEKTLAHLQSVLRVEVRMDIRPAELNLAGYSDIVIKLGAPLTVQPRTLVQNKVHV